MKKFNYKFESIKKVKLAFEKKAQKEVAEIEMNLKTIAETREKLTNEKAAEKKRILSKNSLRASEVQFLNSYEKFMNEKIQSCDKQIMDFQKKLSEKLEELKKKTMEYKIFETLEEKHLDLFRTDQNKVEQKEFDEIASIKVSKEKE